jgi:hypothetical protein
MEKVMMPEPTIAAIFAALMKFFGSTMPAAIGSFISLRFIPDGLSKRERFFSLLSGYFLGSYIGRGLVEYLDIKGGHVEDAVIFGVALFGLSFVSNAMIEVQPLIRAVRLKFIGTSRDEPPTREEVALRTIETLVDKAKDKE